MPPRKAAVVSLDRLGRSVDAAIRIAAKRHQLSIETVSMFDRWEIFGRRLRGAVDMAAAFQLAQDVTKSVTVPGLRIEPVVGRIGKDTWFGFIEKGRLPLGLSQ